MVYYPLCGGLMPYMVIVKEKCQICTANRYSTLKLVLKARWHIYFMATSFSKCPPKIQFLSFINKRAYLYKLIEVPVSSDIDLLFFLKKDQTGYGGSIVIKCQNFMTDSSILSVVEFVKNDFVDMLE